MCRRVGATTADGLTGVAAMDVLVNRPPGRGALVPSPGAGMAVVDGFRYADACDA